MFRRSNRNRDESPIPLKFLSIGGETRRGFGRFIAGLSVAVNSQIGAAVIGGAVGGEIATSADDIKKSLLKNKENQDSVSEWLFGERISNSLVDKKFILSTNNPYSKIVGASSHTVAVLSDLRRALRIVDEAGAPPEFISTDSLDGHAVLLGGPVANIYASGLNPTLGAHGLRRR